MHFDISLDLGVLAWDGVLEVASDLTLSLPARDVNGVSEVEPAEQITSSMSGVSEVEPVEWITSSTSGVSEVKPAEWMTSSTSGVVHRLYKSPSS